MPSQILHPLNGLADSLVGILFGTRIDALQGRRNRPLGAHGTTARVPFGESSPYRGLIERLVDVSSRFALQNSCKILCWIDAVGAIIHYFEDIKEDVGVVRMLRSALCSVAAGQSAPLFQKAKAGLPNGIHSGQKPISKFKDFRDATLAFALELMVQGFGYEVGSRKFMQEAGQLDLDGDNPEDYLFLIDGYRKRLSAGKTKSQFRSETWSALHQQCKPNYREPSSMYTLANTLMLSAACYS